MDFLDRDPFDLDGDGRVDGDEFFVAGQLMAGSRQEAIDLTGDDTFYTGDDDIDSDSDDFD